jgi:hypothetical protein
MRVYKEKQFLVFDFEDGRNVKYDFSTKYIRREVEECAKSI